MKRFLCLLLLLCLVPLFSLADPGVALCYRMYFYAAEYNEDHPGYFSFDTMVIDLYFMDDFSTAYYCQTEWAGGSVDTTGYTLCTVSGKGPDGKRTLSFPNGQTMSFFYDDAGEFWLEMNNGTYHLLPCERFDVRQDLK